MIEDSFIDGLTYVKQDYIFKNVKKPTESYKIRKKMAVYFNFIAPIVKEFTGYIYNIQPTSELGEIDETAQLFDEICISPGKRGLQILVNPVSISKITGAQFVSLILNRVKI